MKVGDLTVEGAIAIGTNTPTATGLHIEDKGQTQIEIIENRDDTCC